MPQETDNTQNPFLSKTLGKGDQGSRGKSQSAQNRAEEQENTVNKDESWPTGATGTPMVKAEICASELIPTGQYANVTVGPVRLSFLIDPDRDLDEGQGFFTSKQRERIAQALNEGADIVEGDCVAVQRNLVLENLQENIGK